jgi:DNA-binding response OmpR family regulator
MPTDRSSCVLVAEDDPSLQRLLLVALRRRRCDVDVAGDGAEAIRLLQKHRWSVLVLDLMMPTLSGWDVIQWLAAHRQLVPRTVLVVSAADRSVLKDLDPSVVNGIFFKPYDVFQLTSYVKASVDLARPDRRHARLVGV